MDRHGVAHVKETLARLSEECAEETSCAADDRARELLRVFALIEPWPDTMSLSSAMMAAVGRHLAAAVADQPDDLVPILRQWVAAAENCGHPACRGASTKPLQLPSRAPTRKLAPATRFTQTVLRVLGDLAWLRLQSLAHATLQPPAEAPAGAAAILDARTKVLYREPPAGVASDLMLAAINLVGSVRVPVAALKLAVQDAVPADAAADFWSEIEDALGPEMRTFLSWLPETQLDTQEAAHVAPIDPR